MGLGIHLTAELSGASHFDHGPLAAIEMTALEHVEAFGLRAFFLSQLHHGKLYLQLHPAAEWVEFELLESGTLSCMAKTSTVGPGYHRYVVDVLDAIAKHLGISWHVGDDFSGDDTGYFEQRNFVRLQHEMIVCLENMASIVREQNAKGVSRLMLNMPVGFAVAEVGGIVTPGGIFALELFEDAVRPGFDVERFAKDFFLWWDEGLTAQTWKNIGRALAWCEVPWHVPDNERETDVTTKALMCFDRARALDPTIALPEREIVELAGLLAENADWGHEAAPEGIGYRRLNWKRNIGGHWVVNVPGYFYSKVEDDNATEVFWLGGREIWCTTYAMEPAKPAILASLGEDLKPDSLIVEAVDFVGCANVKISADSCGANHKTMSCRFQAAGQFAVFTIVYPDDTSFPWAERTFRSVRFVPRLDES